MINAGTHEVSILGDKWTVVTNDQTLSAQWEHTIMVVKNGYEVLTLSQREKNKDNGILLGILPADYQPSI
jgi:methionyl aminopeptidase